MIETLLGGLLGGFFRLTPELLKLVDRQNECQHELAMQDKALEFDKLHQAQHPRENDAPSHALWNTNAQRLLDPVNLRQQQSTRLRWADALSMTVRPIITYGLMIFYCIMKLLTVRSMIQAQVPWMQAQQLLWTEADQALWAAVLNFWFLGRIFDRVRP